MSHMLDLACLFAVCLQRYGDDDGGDDDAEAARKRRQFQSRSLKNKKAKVFR